MIEEWVKDLKGPALVMAAGVIWLMFQIRKPLMAEVTAYNRTLGKMAAVLDIICRRVESDARRKDGELR